jgi:thymidine phosphorylase
MKTLEQARTLAETMRELGERAGRRVTCLMTDMDQPLGQAVGNALEIKEARATLVGEGPDDFTELVLTASAHLLALSDLGVDEEEGRRRAEAAIREGTALERYGRWVRAQGGDPSDDALPRAAVVRTVEADGTGYVRRLRALPVGIAALELGAGRARKDDAIDHAVGVVCLRKRGDEVERGEPIAEIHARTDEAAAAAADVVLGAYEVGAEPPEHRPIVLDVIA